MRKKIYLHKIVEHRRERGEKEREGERERYKESGRERPADI